MIPSEPATWNVIFELKVHVFLRRNMAAMATEAERGNGRDRLLAAAREGQEMEIFPARRESKAQNVHI